MDGFFFFLLPKSYCEGDRSLPKKLTELPHFGISVREETSERLERNTERLIDMEKALNRQRVLLDHLRTSSSSPPQSHESADALFVSLIHFLIIFLLFFPFFSFKSGFVFI